MQFHCPAEWTYVRQTCHEKTWARYNFDVYLVSLCEDVFSILSFFVALLAPTPQLFLRIDIWVSHVVFTGSCSCTDLWNSLWWHFGEEISSPAQMLSIISAFFYGLTFQSNDCHKNKLKCRKFAIFFLSLSVVAWETVLGRRICLLRSFDELSFFPDFYQHSLAFGKNLPSWQIAPLF